MRLNYLLLWLLGAVVTTSLSAQTMAERHENANNYIKKYDALMFYHKLNSEWVGSTNTFWYSVNTPSGVEYFKVDAKKKSKSNAFNAQKVADILSKESGNTINAYELPITDVRLSDDLKTLTYSFQNSRYRVDLQKYTFTKEVINNHTDNRYWGTVWKDATDGVVTSPDGKKNAYIFAFNIWIKDVESGQTKQYTFDGSQGAYYSSSFIWSADSKYIASQKVRPAPVHQLHLIESSPKDQFLPKVHTRDYLKPGDALTVRIPVLTDIEKGTSKLINFNNVEQQFSITAPVWNKANSYFTFAFNERGHQAYTIYKVDAKSGNCSPIIEEKSNTFIYYRRLFRHDIEDKNEIIWSSERDGWHHLYLYNSETATVKRQLTKGEWVMKQVVRVDEAKREILFIGCGRDKDEDPYLEKYYLLNIDSGAITNLTPENASHVVKFSADYSLFVDTYSRVDMEPTTVLRDGRNGKIIMELEKADISKAIEAGWRYPEVLTAKGRDGVTDIWGVIERPRDFDENKKYPVIEYIYAGPHDSFVPKTFNVGYRFSPLTELGFIAVQIDGMGTANRSKAFHDVAWKNLKDAGFPDRIAWMKKIAEKYPQMDLSAVGIYGNSAGGQSSLAALLFHPEFYKVAVPSCGCHDNRVDKIWWNEQWMGYPIGEHYAENSNVVNAHKLEGKLMIIVGELDDNVDPASTFQVVDALMKAEKDFECVVVPGMGHSIGNHYIERRRRDFFIKHLMNIDPSDWNRMKPEEIVSKRANYTPL